MRLSLPPALLAVLFIGRLAVGFLVAWLYWRGGLFLVCWWTFLLECRHLLAFTGSP